MTMQLVFGELFFNQPREGTGRVLTSDSFTVRSGNVPCAVNHWRDNDRVLSCQAMWAAGATSLMISHILDDRIEYEAKLLQKIARQELFWSYGDGAHPEATRLAIAGDVRHVPYKVKPLENVRIGHVSYVAVPAFFQEPIRWVGYN